MADCEIETYVADSHLWQAGQTTKAWRCLTHGVQREYTTWEAQMWTELYEHRLAEAWLTMMWETG